MNLRKKKPKKKKRKSNNLVQIMREREDKKEERGVRVEMVGNEIVNKRGNSLFLYWRLLLCSNSPLHLSFLPFLYKSPTLSFSLPFLCRFSFLLYIIS